MGRLEVKYINIKGGKTHTMGTATVDFNDKSSIGIIPRTIYDIFNEI